MLLNKQYVWLYTLAVVYLLLNIYVLFNQAYYFYLFNCIPAVLLGISLAIFSLDKLVLLTVFFTPLAINLQNLTPGLSLSVPTEPILAGIMLLYWLSVCKQGIDDKRILKHPITLAIFFNLFWIFMTTITSELPVVSIKFFVSRLWFLTTFYFISITIFRNIANIDKFHWLYISALTVVIVITLVKHAAYNFDEKPANWIMTPFYNDHTAYGAALAMFFPILISFLLYSNYNLLVKIITLGLFSINVIAIVFSYTRAAWVSIFAALVVLVFMLLKIKFRTIFLVAAFGGLLFFAFKTDILIALERNRQDSSSDFAEHIQSISNVSSDASNLERLNRWNCAFKMFDERPFWGWGPGAYSFLYAPYQEAKDKTIISTNRGDGGNAHSEYIGPLAESGVIGMLSFVFIILTVVSTGFKLFYEFKNTQLKIMIASILLGLITYFVHGGLNNFLDTDKLSAPFWGFIAMLVAIDLYHRDKMAKLIE